MSFESFGLHPSLMRGVADLGFSMPSPIQKEALPPGLAGRDLLACAATGSGKTAAFGLPLLQRLCDKPRGTTRALIVTPTRELAQQIGIHLRDLGRHTSVRVATIYGGVGLAPQAKDLRCGVDVIVATPGRLLDHLRRPQVRLDGVEVLVLDEADRMLDMGFLPDVHAAFRGDLAEVVDFNDKQYKLGILPKEDIFDDQWRRSHAEAVNFTRFCQEFIYPYWKSRGRLKSLEDLWNLGDVLHLTRENSSKIHVIVAGDDPLNAPEEFERFKKHAASPTFTLLPRGGHLGYTTSKWSQSQIKRYFK